MKKFVLCCMSAVMILGASTLSSSAAAGCGSWANYGQSTTYCGTPICYDNTSNQVHTKTPQRRTCWKNGGSSYYEYRTLRSNGKCC